MITRIPISKVQKNLLDIIAGLGADDEVWITDEQGKVLGRLLPGFSVAQRDSQSVMSDKQRQEALHRLTTRYDGGEADVSIDRVSINQ